MENWAFTIKYNPNDCTAMELADKYKIILKHWMKQKSLTIINYRYEEVDKQGNPTKLHLHGTVEIPKVIYRKKLMLPNYHVKLVHGNSGQWQDYINKNVKVKMFKNESSTQVLKPDGGPPPNNSPEIPRPTRPLFKRTENQGNI